MSIEFGFGFGKTNMAAFLHDGEWEIGKLANQKAGIVLIVWFVQKMQVQMQNKMQN